MKTGSKKIIAGITILVLLLSSASSVFASNGQNFLEVYYKDIKVELNGKIIDLKDADGNRVEPFISDGTTYLPIRAIGSALGFNVAWNSTTNTAVLSSPPQSDMETVARVWEAYRLANRIYSQCLWAVSEFEYSGSTSTSVRKVTDVFYGYVEIYNSAERDYNKDVTKAYSYVYEMLSPAEEVMYSLAKYKVNPSSAEADNFYTWLTEVQKVSSDMEEYYNSYIPALFSF